MKVQQLLALAAAGTLITSASASVTMDWVTVGNANNAADTTGYGAVDHVYQIGKYEVTNAQYGEFLNAKGSSNTNGIYNTDMASSGITRSGSSGSYTYSVTGALANRPVVQVSWFDAARFANWMMNGQGSSDMEDGAYTLNGAISGIIFANAGAQIYLPSENEWYKAAYYNATTTSYSLYPNGQNTISSQDANYNNQATGSTSDVGTYTNDASPYGTFDQGGNAWEWDDGVASGSSRVLRGGSWASNGLNSSIRSSAPASFEGGADGSTIGFRLASASVPEPTSILLTMFAGAVLLIRRKR